MDRSLTEVVGAECEQHQSDGSNNVRGNLVDIKTQCGSKHVLDVSLATSRTVYKFVFTVEYPRLATICGKKLFTLARGTPSDRLIHAQTQYRQSLKGWNAVRMLSFSFTTEDESARMR